MPQVNEVSWMNLSFKFGFLFVILFASYSFLSTESSNLKNFSLKIFSFNFLI